MGQYGEYEQYENIKPTMEIQFLYKRKNDEEWIGNLTVYSITDKTINGVYRRASISEIEIFDAGDYRVNDYYDEDTNLKYYENKEKIFNIDNYNRIKHRLDNEYMKTNTGEDCIKKGELYFRLEKLRDPLCFYKIDDQVEEND